MATISIHIQGLDQLRHKLNGAHADAPISRYLDRGAFFLQGKARAKAAVDRGQMRNSVGTEKVSTRERRVGPSAKQGPFQEFGTRPHFPPVAPIEAWAWRHGMPGAGYSIARKIARRGTKARPFLQPAADETSVFMSKTIPVLAGEIEAAFAAGGR